MLVKKGAAGVGQIGTSTSHNGFFSVSCYLSYTLFPFVDLFADKYSEK